VEETTWNKLFFQTPKKYLYKSPVAGDGAYCVAPSTGSTACMPLLCMWQKICNFRYWPPY